MMNTTIEQGTAKIYQFPIGGRRALEAKRFDNGKSATDLNSQRVLESVVGGSWYHEAAIRESEPTRKP